MLRRAVRIFFVLVGVVVSGAIVAGVLIVRQIGTLDRGEVEQWIGRQFAGIANNYLVPELHWDEFRYAFPYTVRLRNVTLSAEDPDHPGGRVNVLEIARVSITLAELPRLGRPVRIESVTLTDPVFRLIRAADGSLIGLSPLIAEDGRPEMTTDDGQTIGISDIIRIRLVRLVNGSLVYDRRADGQGPLLLDGLALEATVAPEETGLYRFDLDLDLFTVGSAKRLQRVTHRHHVRERLQELHSCRDCRLGVLWQFHFLHVFF